MFGIWGSTLQNSFLVISVLWLMLIWENPFRIGGVDCLMGSSKPKWLYNVSVTSLREKLCASWEYISVTTCDHGLNVFDCLLILCFVASFETKFPRIRLQSWRKILYLFFVGFMCFFFLVENRLVYEVNFLNIYFFIRWLWKIYNIDNKYIFD